MNSKPGKTIYLLVKPPVGIILSRLFYLKSSPDKMVYFKFIVGFILLIKSADILIKGSSNIARKYGVSDFVIGLTIVSMGTSMPELLVNIVASINGSHGIAIGNIFGSNITNVLLILGLSAIIKPLSIQKRLYISEIPMLLASTFMVGYLANANFFTTTQSLELSRFDGLMMLLFFILFMAYIFSTSKSEVAEELSGYKNTNLKKSFIYIFLGIIGLFFGGEWVVEGAVEFAKIAGLSEAFIGLTIIAVGTSLPELVTSIVAAMKGNSDIAVGNVVGSNIFNILWVLGLSATINPLIFNVTHNIDLSMVILSSVLLIFSIIVGHNRRIIDRASGISFVLTYIFYMCYLIYRG